MQVNIFRKGSLQVLVFKASFSKWRRELSEIEFYACLREMKSLRHEKWVSGAFDFLLSAANRKRRGERQANEASRLIGSCIVGSFVIVN